MARRERWDLFCRVVDNYGDVGVAWRLARALSTEQRKRVRLFLDNLTVLAKLRPGTDVRAQSQRLDGIEVVRWAPAFATGDDFPEAEVADVVVETFACDTPAAYVKSMAARRPMPRWINLEYLSAEAWVEGTHALPSPHPRFAPLTRHFFFPGFTGRTGGLLREHGLLERRDAFQADRDTQAAFWRGLVGREPPDHALRLSLFGYSAAPWVALLEALVHDPRPVWLVAPEGVAASEVSRWLGGRSSGRKGSVEAFAVPFLDGGVYDELLWASDLNFVRGEDSFVRAQWAARPFVWQAYPQDAGAHEVKIAAFLARFCGAMDPAHREAFTGLWTAWNRHEGLAEAWPAFSARLPAFAAHTESWTESLAARPDLASQLADFADNVLAG